jgi:uncharacterized protein
MKTIGRLAIGILLGAFAVGCSGSKGGTGDPAERERRALALVDLTAKGDYDAAREDFNLLMSFSLSSDRLKGTWSALQDQFGVFQKRTWTKHGEHKGYDFLYVGLSFKNAAMKAKIVFDSGDKVTGLFFEPSAEKWKAPDYVESSRFIEEEVSFGHDEWRVAATLSLPKDVTKSPAVILVHGSGPHDRDESIGPNKPFRDLAWGLASQGIAVLRYEKRTKAHQGKMARATTFTMKEETVDDAVYAFDFLEGRPDIDSAAIHVLGHSQGGYCAPRIAAGATALAGFISLAGNSRPLEDLIVEQTEYLMTVNPKQQMDLKALQLGAAQIKKLTPADARSRGVMLGAPMSYWFDLKHYRPVQMATAFKGRILILQGGRDYQVVRADYDGWTNGLAGHAHLEAKLFPKLNHLMIAGEGKSVPSEYQKTGHVDSEVIETVAAWVKQRGQSAAD